MMRKIKQKHIEAFLQDVPDFETETSDSKKLKKKSKKEKDDPEAGKIYDKYKKNDFEQHITPPLIAATALHQIYMRENVEDYSVVGDFGCGTGQLMSGLMFLGAGYAIGIDCDLKYLNIAHEYIENKFERERFELIAMNMKNFFFKSPIFDIVITNPPFGTKEAGIDKLFIEKAFESCSGNIYSFHKASTREHLMKFCEANNRKFELIANFNQYPLPKRYVNYHKLDVGYTDVDFICYQAI